MDDNLLTLVNVELTSTPELTPEEVDHQERIRVTRLAAEEAYTAYLKACDDEADAISAATDNPTEEALSNRTTAHLLKSIAHQKAIQASQIAWDENPSFT